MFTSTKAVVAQLGFFSFTFAAGIANANAANPVIAAHVEWAELAAYNVAPENNEYGTNPTVLTWVGVAGATQYINRTVCSSFLTRVLEQTYGWTDADMTHWLGVPSPLAVDYHDAIVNGNGFIPIKNVSDIRIGDILAAKYPDDSTVSGHVMIAVDLPALRGPTKPVVVNTLQYEIDVADCSSTGHGSADTRLMPDGSWDSGAGVGGFRLYANPAGIIVGYTWSTSSSSIYYNMKMRHLAVGRLNHR